MNPTDFEVIFLGRPAAKHDQEVEEKIVSPMQYLLEVYRQASLADNDRQTVLTQDDQLIALQLCMAQYNKQVSTLLIRQHPMQHGIYICSEHTCVIFT